MLLSFAIIIIMSQKNQQPAAAAACSSAERADEPDWRTEEMDTNQQRYAYLLETGDGADVHFLVGKPDEEKELIAGHETILFVDSSVFETQFSFGNAIHTKEGTEEKPIEVQDVRPNAFRAMQKFIYTDDFSGVTKQNIMDVFYAAKKYMLHRLIKQCRQSLFNGQNLDESNALSVLKHSQQHEDKELIDHCWSFVDRNATAILNSEEFFALNQHDLCELFSRDGLDVGEFVLFQSIHRWAEHQCETTGLENTAENLRDIIGPAIYQIRFPLLPVLQFNEEIVPSGLLTEKDMLALYLHFTGDQSSPNARRQFPNRFNGRQRCVCKSKLMCWNNNKWSSDGLYISNTDGQFTYVRAHQPISRALLALIPGQKLVYWEVQMMKGSATHIGWVGPNFPLDTKWIGKHPGSFAIDWTGHYWESGESRVENYGKGFFRGDVVGTGLLLIRDNRLRLFFTLNGALNGEPIVLTDSEDSKDLLLHPAVGFYWKDASVEAKFGMDPTGKPFMFDVNAHEMELFG